MLNRRDFLRSSLQITALSLLNPPALAANSTPTLLSADWANEGSISAPSFGALGGKRVMLPSRGHAILPLPNGEAIVVSRRLGLWLARINWQRGEVLQMVDAAFDRHFFGHGLLTPDGSTLLTTENNDDTSAGLIGIYDAVSLKRLGEIPSGGIGPHELLWLSPGKILAVANGGILTLPETGRTKLNLGAMSASITLLEWPSGKVIDQFSLSDKALSLRHLALAADGTLGIAMQAEYPNAKQHRDAPLLALLNPQSGRLTVAAQSEGLMGYGASIAAVGNEFLITALRGNQLGRWRSDGAPLPTLSLPRPAGIASHNNTAWISSENGGIYQYQPQDQTLKALDGYTQQKWDNHLVIAA
ncbi:DUF1513 domain-containing protein [Chitinibacter sp. SCUT-21]|uniref:DUF1513 domain-containing protein n=1 Tax=Chitinibacter sp. SCUT-21 TaxID=2970891 RepID=UPI0035A5B09F